MAARDFERTVAELGVPCCFRKSLPTWQVEKDLFDKVAMNEICQLSADEGSHIDDTKASNGRELREQFGLQPLMVSCWTCYLGCLHADAMKAMEQASDKRLLEIVAGLKSEGNLAPGPHTIAKVLIGRNALKTAATRDCE